LVSQDEKYYIGHIIELSARNRLGKDFYGNQPVLYKQGFGKKLVEHKTDHVRQGEHAKNSIKAGKAARKKKSSHSEVGSAEAGRSAAWIWVGVLEDHTQEICYALNR